MRAATAGLQRDAAGRHRAGSRGEQCRAGDGEVLDRQARGVQQRRRVRAAAAGGVAGEDGAERCHLLAHDATGRHRAGQLTAVRGLLPLVAEQLAGDDGVDARLGLARAVGAEHVRGAGPP